MSGFRYYLGIHGETVPVRDHMISTVRLDHGMGAYPFAEIAKGLGDRRDRFASLCQTAPWIDSALSLKAVRAVLAPNGGRFRRKNPKRHIR